MTLLRKKTCHEGHLHQTWWSRRRTAFLARALNSADVQQIVKERRCSSLFCRIISRSMVSEIKSCFTEEYRGKDGLCWMLSTAHHNKGCALSPDPKCTPSAPKTGSEVIGPPEQDCQNLTVTGAGKQRAEKLPINHWLLEPSPVLPISNPVICPRSASFCPSRSHCIKHLCPVASPMVIYCTCAKQL